VGGPTGFATTAETPAPWRAVSPRGLGCHAGLFEGPQAVRAPINQTYRKPGYFAKIAILASLKLARNPVLD